METPLRILIVEDQESDAALIIRQLERAGHDVAATQVDSAAQMEQALHAQDWDLVISDYQLPGFGGDRALELVQQTGKDIPFILISGTVGEETAVGLMKRGASDYLLKGSIVKLPAVVRRELTEARNRQARREAEAEIRKAKERFDLAVRGSSDGIWDWDVPQDQAYFSPRFRELLGYPPAAHSGSMEVLIQSVHPDDLPKLLEALEAHLHRQARFQVEYRLRMRAGEYRWFLVRGQAVWDEAGRPVRMAGSLTDIHARMRAQEVLQQASEAIRRSEQRFRAIYDHMFQLMVILSPDGLVQDANPAALGYGPLNAEEVLDRPFAEAPWWDGPPELRQQLEDALRRAAAGEFVRYETAIRAGSGRSATLDLSLRPIRDAGGQVQLIIAEGRDMTESIEARKALERAFEVVNSQNKRLLNFSYIVSHNLRSHTSSISTILQYLEEVDDPQEQAEMLRNLGTIAHALDETLHNLNEVVSIQTHLNLKTELLDLHEFVQKSGVVLSKEILSRQARIENLVPPGQMIRYNAAYLESILINFLSNALRYSHPDRQPQIEIGYCDAGPKACFWVRDNGLGINLQKAGDKLFGMYKTFHGNPDAKGIGLFITRNQVEAMGGSIEVRSEPDQGSTFIVYLA
ncbi:MAG: PAS domain-containing protein [Bacteroidia bacterium]|nr:PAS domain-containing protein [Bacteroidia bacterium]